MAITKKAITANLSSTDNDINIVNRLESGYEFDVLSNTNRIKHKENLIYTDNVGETAESFVPLYSYMISTSSTDNDINKLMTSYHINSRFLDVENAILSLEGQTSDNTIFSIVSSPSDQYKEIVTIPAIKEGTQRGGDVTTNLNSADIIVVGDVTLNFSPTDDIVVYNATKSEWVITTVSTIAYSAPNTNITLNNAVTFTTTTGEIYDSIENQDTVLYIGNNPNLPGPSQTQGLSVRTVSTGISVIEVWGHGGLESNEKLAITGGGGSSLQQLGLSALTTIVTGNMTISGTLGITGGITGNLSVNDLTVSGVFTASAINGSTLTLTDDTHTFSDTIRITKDGSYNYIQGGVVGSDYNIKFTKWATNDEMNEFDVQSILSNFSNNVTIGNDLDIGNDLTVGGVLSIPSISTSGNVSVGGDFGVNGNISTNIKMAGFSIESANDIASTSIQASSFMQTQDFLGEEIDGTVTHRLYMIANGGGGAKLMAGQSGTGAGADKLIIKRYDGAEGNLDELEILSDLTTISDNVDIGGDVDISGTLSANIFSIPNMTYYKASFVDTGSSITIPDVISGNSGNNIDISATTEKMFSFDSIGLYKVHYKFVFNFINTVSSVKSATASIIIEKGYQSGGAFNVSTEPFGGTPWSQWKPGRLKYETYGASFNALEKAAVHLNGTILVDITDDHSSREGIRFRLGEYPASSVNFESVKSDIFIEKINDGSIT